MTISTEVEEERVDRLARVHKALADAQDRAYWLDRWGLDLNALMRRPGASQFRAILRIGRASAHATINTRNRAQSLATRLRALAAGSGAPPITGVPGEPGPTDALFARSLSPSPLNAAPVADVLYERLSEDDIAQVERAAGLDAFSGMDPANRRRLVLHLGVHHCVPGVLERTGLRPDMPPEEVHSMARGKAAAGGSTYYADLVADGFAASGSPIEAGMRALDFGCSSGRVVRVLRAAYPECEWHGCDPIPDAVEWASTHLPGVSFARSPEAPPLAYEAGSFDLVFAISIWSHFAAREGAAWLAEMRRILKPGGALLLTSHGLGAVALNARADSRSEAELRMLAASLYADGFWFDDEFGETGDHGVVNPGWGTAFFTPEWLLARVLGEWRVSAFASARVEDNQDMYVLERR